MTLVLITGANQGIGLGLARAYHDRGDTVIATCRHLSEELSAIGCEIVQDVDVCRDEDMVKLTESLADRPLDLLINNAGILISDGADGLDYDAMRRQYEVNTLGPLRVSKALAGHMSKGGKIGIVSSRVGSLADNTSGGNWGYRMSKAAVNMMGVNLCHELKPKGIAVALLHPGYVRTNLTGGTGFTDITTSAKGLVERMDALSMDSTGTFWHAEGYELPW